MRALPCIPCCGTCHYNRTHMGCQCPESVNAGIHTQYDDCCDHWKEYQFDPNREWEMEYVAHVKRIDEGKEDEFRTFHEERCPWCGHSHGNPKSKLVYCVSYERECDKCNKPYSIEAFQRVEYISKRKVSGVS